MIEFRDVHKTYVSKRETDVDALKGVSFKIESGEFVFIIGRSGSGKSTLMKCITREEVPEEGEVLIDGFDISSMPRALIPVLRRHIGMIYQDFRLIESKTVSENIAFAGEIVGIPRKNLDRTVQLVLNVVGLKDKADSYPQELSGGEQQRVAIARAMVNTPKLVVADEPTGDLDPETSETIMALLLDINKSGSTVIVCTHDSNLVDRMKKRVIELRDGKIIRDKKDSGYEDIPEEEPVASLETLNVAFGDDPAFKEDADYSDSFDDEGYDKPQQEPLLVFGDDPEGVAKAADQAASEEVSEAAAEVSEPLFEDEVKKPEDIISEEPVYGDAASDAGAESSSEVSEKELGESEEENSFVAPASGVIMSEAVSGSDPSMTEKEPVVEEIPYVPWTDDLEGVDDQAGDEEEDGKPSEPAEEDKTVEPLKDAPSENEIHSSEDAEDVPEDKGMDFTFGDEVRPSGKAGDNSEEEIKEETKDEESPKDHGSDPFDGFLDLDIQEDDN